MPTQGNLLGRETRLSRPGQYRRVFAHPSKAMDDLFVVLARTNNQASARLGLAVAKKSARRAIDRNRIKRIVREFFRLHRRALGGIDLVVISRPGVALRSNAVLRASLASLWPKIISKCADS